MSRYALREYQPDHDDGVDVNLVCLREWKPNEFYWFKATPEHPASVFTGDEGLANARAAAEFMREWSMGDGYAVVRLDDDCEEP